MFASFSLPEEVSEFSLDERQDVLA